MSTKSEEILREILTLPPAERAELAENILTSLESLDPEIEKLWAVEAEARVAAFERGEIEAIDADDVFAEIDRQKML
jgi:putative addiction module component (TIGR02574 family)